MSEAAKDGLKMVQDREGNGGSEHGSNFRCENVFVLVQVRGM